MGLSANVSWTLQVGSADGPCPTREVSGRPGGAPPALPVSRHHFRHRPDLREHRGVVASNPRRGAPAQGPAVLPSPGRERRHGIHRLRLRAEFAARQYRRAVAPPAGARDVRPERRRHLSGALPAAPALKIASLPEKRPLGRAAVADFRSSTRRRSYFFAGGGVGGSAPVVAPAFSLASCCFLYSSII